MTTTHVPTANSYSAAVAAGDLVFLGHHRGSGETFVEQLDSAVVAVRRTLGELGLALDDLVQVHVWLRDARDIEAMEHRFREYFPSGRFPARMSATTEFFDDNCLVMIDGVAARA